MEIKDSEIEKNWTPTLRDLSSDFLCEKISKLQPKRILEIGTYLGRSGTLMLNICPNAHLTTIEIDKERSLNAIQNFDKNGLTKRVKVVNCDAFDYISTLESREEKFDFIFLDGPKGQYSKYLPILKKLLEKKGALFADNIFFHGMVKGGYPKHKHRTIVVKLRKFLQEIQDDKDFESEIFEIEDGIIYAILKN